MPPPAPPSFEQIAAGLQGYDPQDMPVSTAQAFIAQLAQPALGYEVLALTDALDRVLAHDLICPINVPPHDNAAMDGFAFAGSALQHGLPLQLTVQGTALAGSVWRGALAHGACVKVMTGAVMPEGADTVVPREAVHIDGTRVLVPADAVARGDNRRLAGEDLRAGSAALRAGTWLGPAALGLVASLGLDAVSVRQRLSVAYFSSGSELSKPGQARSEGAVYDSNRYTITGMLRRMGIAVVDLGTVPDEPSQLEATLRSAAAAAHMVITTGGASLGEADHTRRMFAALGETVFWQLAIRPGRPLALGRLSPAGAQAADPTAQPGVADHSTLLFGLPGNPVAAMVAFLVLVRPALLRMMGCTDTEAPLVHARMEHPVRKKPGRTEYLRGVAGHGPSATTGSPHPAASTSSAAPTETAGAPSALHVRLTGEQGSGLLSSMVQANVLIVLPEACAGVAAGETVSVMMLSHLR